MVQILFQRGHDSGQRALPLVMQVYLDSSVDGGFVNTFAKAFKQEPEDVRNQRIEDMKQELAEYIDSDGNLTVYRGSFERHLAEKTTPAELLRRICFQPGQGSGEKLCHLLVP